MAMPMSSTMSMMHMGNSTMDHSSHGNSTMDHSGHGNSTMDHSGHGNSTMDHSGHGTTEHMMQMWFYFGVNVTILFESWSITTAGQLGGACVGVFLLAALYEGLKVLREVLLHKMSAKRRQNAADSADYQNGVALMDSTAMASPPRSTMWSSWHLLQTFLHLLQVTISYALMLIFMTYNGYLAISILIGASVGYFVFGWKKAVIIDINEHCH